MFFFFCSSKYIITSANVEKIEEEKKDYIKWVDFNVNLTALEKTADLDIYSHTNNSEIKYNWIEILAYFGCKYGGNLNNFKQKDLDKLVSEIQNNNTSVQELMKDNKYYQYYLEAYGAILKEFIGNYSIETLDEQGNKIFKEKYGVKAFSPIAKNYGFSHYDDFGASRSYGYKRVHLGNDLMGSIGTPVIAVESGIIEAIGWNMYRWLENWY